MMKKIFFLATLIILPVFNYAQWTALNSGTSANIKEIFFKNENLGFYVGGQTFENSFIARTSNGGQSWQRKLEDSGIVWRQIIAATNGDLYVYGRNENQQSVCAKSTNNGSSWSIDTLSFLPIYSKFYEDDLYFKSFMSSVSVLKRAFANGSQTLLENIYLFDINEEGSLFCLKFNTEGAYINTSYDGGNTWIATTSITATSGGAPTHSSPVNGNLKSFHDTLILTVTYPNQICFSYNAGNTWGTYQANDIPGAYIPIYIISPKKLIGTQPANEIKKSNDGGASFFSQGITPEKINKFFFVNENLGFLCGDNGMIYKTTNGGGLPTNIKETGTLKKKLKIFPNPAKSKIRLQYDNLTIQSLQLTDLSGRIIKKFLPESKILDVSGVAAGMYFLKVKAKEGEMVEKVLLK